MTFKKTLTSIILSSSLALANVGCQKTENQKPVAVTPSLGMAVGIATGDMNGDGKLDIVVSTSGYDSTANVYLNTNLGDNKYETKKIGSTPSLGRIVSVATGDMNGDGKLDIVVSTLGYDSTANVYVLLNNGNGTFSLQK